jgi:hypothetical protein
MLGPEARPPRADLQAETHEETVEQTIFKHAVACWLADVAASREAP